MNCFAKLYGVLEHLLVRLREKKDKPAFANIMKFRKHLFLKPVLTVLSCFLRCGRWILLFDVAYSWLFGATKLYNPGFIDRWSPMSNHFLTRCPSLFPLRLPYLGVFPFTFYLPLDFINISSLRPTYLHPHGRPFTYSLFC